VFAGGLEKQNKYHRPVSNACCNAAAGYEEAASQGLLAGLNAARRAQELDTVILPRDSSYMGTLVDDLVTKDLREPYRMLTSRCVWGGAGVF
jgi:tRNA U34 5-carboxymethylaminomethyl modifying enzyme MnmG/GidA